VSMTGKIEQVEVITSVQRRRRLSADEKAAVGLAGARRHGIAPNQLFRWRRLYVEGALSAPSADIVRSKKTRPAPTRGKSRIGRGWGRKLRGTFGNRGRFSKRVTRPKLRTGSETAGDFPGCSALKGNSGQRSLFEVVNLLISLGSLSFRLRDGHD
jgi:hypothetical protein